MDDGWVWAREAALAIGLISMLIGGMHLATGAWPPMVVIESGSMMHEEEGSLGAIDPGDISLVMAPERVDIVTWVEATQPGNPSEGYERHGMPGDVIIYRKNGGTDTPVIHRAILEAVAHTTETPMDREAGQCGNGSWDPVSLDADGRAGTCVLTWRVPGTDLIDVEDISLELDYECKDGTRLVIDAWDPGHAGFLTTGDNPSSNGCRVDQIRATDADMSHTMEVGRGLNDENGWPVRAVRADQLVGVSSTELPWVGSIKLLVADNAAAVPGKSWLCLILVAATMLALPMVWEQFSTRFLKGSPEVDQAAYERHLGPSDTGQDHHEEEGDDEE